jgi:hypothetical protein
LVLALFGALGLLTGCGTSATPANSVGGAGGGGANPGPAGGKPATTPAPQQGGAEMKPGSKLKKKIDFLDWQNEMRQIAQYYKLFELERNRSPKDVREFQDYVKKDWPDLVKWIDEGYYVVLPNVRPPSGNIIAYQNRDLRFGTRYVVRMDGSFHELPEMQFQQELKQQTGK